MLLLSLLKTVRGLSKNRLSRWAILAALRGDLQIERSGVTLKHRSKKFDLDLKLGEISDLWNYNLAEPEQMKHRRGDTNSRPRDYLSGPAWGIFGELKW